MAGIMGVVIVRQSYCSAMTVPGATMGGRAAMRADGCAGPIGLMVDNAGKGARPRHGAGSDPVIDMEQDAG